MMGERKESKRGEMGGVKVGDKKVFPMNLNGLVYYPCYKTDFIQLLIT
jgi:hypothetical protein